MSEKYAPHQMSEEAISRSTLIRNEASCLDALIASLPKSREQSLAITKLEECVMWANKALALYG